MAKNKNMNLNATVCIPVILIILLGLVVFMQMNKKEKWGNMSHTYGQMPNDFRLNHFRRHRIANPDPRLRSVRRSVRSLNVPT